MTPYRKLFKQLRKELGVTQVRLAKELSCSQSLVSKIESGRMEPPLQVFLSFLRLAARDGGERTFDGLMDLLWGGLPASAIYISRGQP